MAQSASEATVGGPIEAMTFVSTGGQSIDFHQVKKAGGVLSIRNCHIKGKLGGEGTGNLRFVHWAAERVIAESTIAAGRSGKFEVRLGLMRGRNNLRFESVEKPDQVFEFDIFHRGVVREWVESILKALVLVLVVKTFVVQAFFIPTPSMEDTLLRHDYILVEKISYLFDKPSKGNIVVFEYPEDPSKDFIKRLVGTGGDTIEIKNRDFYLNGGKLDEPYVRHETLARYAETDKRVNYGPYTVTDDHYFVMGDNRDNSKDSREWGPFEQWRLIGKAWSVYFPLGRLGLVRHGLGKPASP